MRKRIVVCVGGNDNSLQFSDAKCNIVSGCVHYKTVYFDILRAKPNFVSTIHTPNKMDFKCAKEK